LVIVDDYTRWSWVKFLKSKDDSYDVFSKFCIQVQSEKELKILKVRSDHGGEFENEPFDIFCEKHGVIYEFSSPRTPQQNGVIERKNRSLQSGKTFLAEAVNTACYVQNRIYIRPLLNKTTYELFKGRKPNISYFHQFGCTCYILNNKVYLKKFDAKAQKGIFLGYSERSKTYRLYNSETLCVEESMHVKFDDKEPGDKTSEQDENFAGSEESDDYSEPDQISDLNDNSKAVTAADTPEATTAPDVPLIEASEEDHNDSQQVIQSRNSFKYKSSHPEDQIIGNKESPRRIRSHFRPEKSALGLLSLIEPTKVDEALADDGWILALQDELNQFKRNDVWDLVSKPEHKNIIGTCWNKGCFAKSPLEF